MGRETEKAMKAMHDFLNARGGEDLDEGGMNELMKEFMTEYNSNQPAKVTEKTAKTADDYLELAEEAASRVKAEKYIKKALELEPDNLDAISASLDITDDSSWEHYLKLKEAVERGTKKMEKDGLMDKDSIGHYWGILETRPYMRLKRRYVDYLIDSGMTEAAVRECEDMIRLSENDNLGVRYLLMHLYAFYGNEKAALKLWKKYDGNKETQMLLPLSILYFRKEEFEKAEEYFSQLMEINKDTKKFFRALKKDDLDRFMEEMNGFGYRPYSIEELITELMENSFLFEIVPLYAEWAYEQTKGKKA